VPVDHTGDLNMTKTLTKENKTKSEIRKTVLEKKNCNTEIHDRTRGETAALVRHR
jgi:hypothetical protein